MRVLAAIRTHRWDEDAMRLHDRLAPVFGPDLAVVFHNRPKGLDLPLPAADVNDGWLAANSLRVLPDYGWRCGDYFYYALRQAYPRYDAYWLIEPDVQFTSDPAPFFAAFAGDATDALGYQAGPYPSSARFAQGVPGIAPMRAIFAMTRLTGRAIDRLFTLRRAYSAGSLNRKMFANDEVFVFSSIAADAAMTWGRLEDKAGSWFDGVQFETNPDLLLDLVTRDAPPGRVLHPVRGRESFRRAVAGRLAANTGFLGRMREALSLMDGSELEAMAADASDRILADLRSQARAGKVAAAPREGAER